MRIAFYAPTVAMAIDRPSGDRLMAKQLMKALQQAGHEVDLVSSMRSYCAIANADRLKQLEHHAKAECQALIAGYGGISSAPQLWFTYHPYYKAPDLIGPVLASHWTIPYVTAEASFAGKRAVGEWADWHYLSLTALTQAQRHFAFTKRDREGLERFGLAAALIHDLPPFIDTQPYQKVPSERVNTGPAQLMTLAMMRGGRKMESFRHLADALSLLLDLPWHLTLYGDGPERHAVEGAFVSLPSQRVTFAGQVDGQRLPQCLGRGDLYVWPGLGEAYGLVYLEAQAAGLPVIAYDSGGIAAAVHDGVSGLLTPEGDKPAFAMAIRHLILNDALRQHMGEAARQWVLSERTLARASERLQAGLAHLIPDHAQRK